MRAMRVANPRVREIQSEMENDEVVRLVYSYQSVIHMWEYTIVHITVHGDLYM